MNNSFLASFLTCHNLQPESTYFYFSYSRNNPALSGSNSSPEEKQPCQDAVVCAVFETWRFPFTAQLHRLGELVLSQAPDPLRAAVWNDKHTAACGEGHRHNRWPGLHQSQAKPTQIINPTAYMANITKHVQNGELSPWKAGVGGGWGK